MSECPQPFPQKTIYFEDSIPTLSRVLTNAMYTFVLLANNHTRKGLFPYPHLSVSQKQDISDSTIQCFIARTLCCASVLKNPQGSSEVGETSPAGLCSKLCTGGDDAPTKTTELWKNGAGR